MTANDAPAPDETSPDETSPDRHDVGNLPATTAAEAEVIDVRHGMFGAHGSGDTSGFGGLRRTVNLPGPTERPYGGDFDVVADTLTAALASAGLTLRRRRREGRRRPGRD